MSNHNNSDLDDLEAMACHIKGQNNLGSVLKQICNNHYHIIIDTAHSMI